MTRSSAFALTLVLGSLTAGAASAGVTIDPATIPITNFRVVTRGVLYRGARPLEQGLEALAQAGIKTDIDLENDGLFSGDEPDNIAFESRAAAALGMRYYSEPINSFVGPSDGRVAEIFSILQNRANYPIYIHCKHGQDRTGLIAALYRVFMQGVDPSVAYDEMLADGFHPILLGLNHYYEETTGFED